MKNAIKFFALLVIITSSVKPAAAQSTNSKVAVINGFLLQDPDKGIKKYVEAQQTLQREFKTLQDELVSMQNKMTDLSKKYNASPTSPEAKKLAEDAEKLERDIKYKKDDLDARSRKRYDQLIQPIMQKVGVLYEKWCKQKGFTAVFDISKDDRGLISWTDYATTDALTLELIQFINSSM